MGWYAVRSNSLHYLFDTDKVASSMLSQAMFNREKWMNAIILDPETGLDPPGVKVRAAQGNQT